MALTTYNELKSSVADWLNRTDLTAVVPDFISLAEAQIERTLRTRQMIVRATASIDSEYSAVPADFLETKSIKLNTSPVTPLQFESVDALDSMKGTMYLANGKPLYFGIVGGQIRVLPVPDSTYTAELTYYAKLSKLSSTNATNWLLTQAPDVYLYGALMQAAPYLKDDDRITIWATMYTRGLEELQVADDRGATSGGSILMRARTFG
jgi:hypothetical protein